MAGECVIPREAFTAKDYLALRYRRKIFNNVITKPQISVASMRLIATFAKLGKLPFPLLELNALRAYCPSHSPLPSSNSIILSMSIKENQDIKEEVEPIKLKVLDVLCDFEKLIDRGCIDNCSECWLNEIIIPESKEAYEYASGKLYGPLTICDFLGILQDEL